MAFLVQYEPLQSFKNKKKNNKNLLVSNWKHKTGIY